MTIDERLDRLTERHEALTQSIELLILDGRENTRNIAAIGRQVEETGRQVAEVSRTVSAVSKTVSQMAASIDTLGRIAEMHEHRLDNLEEA